MSSDSSSFFSEGIPQVGKLRRDLVTPSGKFLKRRGLVVIHESSPTDDGIFVETRHRELFMVSTKSIRVIEGAAYKAVSRSSHSQLSTICKLVPDRLNETWRGATALHRAVSQGKSHVVSKLLKSGAEVDKLNEQGLTPFLVACTTGDIGCAELLLSFRCSMDSFDGQGRTGLHLAVLGAHDGLVTVLLRKGLNVNAVDHMGRTPLHLVAMLSPQTQSSDRIGKSLLQASPEILHDHLGRTPSEYALHEKATALLYRLNVYLRDHIQQSRQRAPPPQSSTSESDSCSEDYSTSSEEEVDLPTHSSSDAGSDGVRWLPAGDGSTVPDDDEDMTFNAYNASEHYRGERLASNSTTGVFSGLRAALGRVFLGGRRRARDREWRQARGLR